MHFRAYIEAKKDIKKGFQRWGRPSNFYVMVALSSEKKKLLEFRMEEYVSIFKRDEDPKDVSIALHAGRGYLFLAREMSRYAAFTFRTSSLGMQRVK